MGDVLNTFESIFDFYMLDNNEYKTIYSADIGDLETENNAEIIIVQRERDDLES